MATRKEYELLFALNAQMNSGFDSTFKNAQSQFVGLGNEIQNLSKVQSDISAYQKQQNAITATGSKLENLKQQHDLLQKEINETTESTTDLEREKLKLEQRIRDTESALERQKQKLDATDAKLKEAGVDTSNLSGESAKLTAQIDDLKDKQMEAANSAENFGETSTSAFEAVQQAIAAAGVAAALKEIADAYMECVTIAADFEETMSTVEALSGASSDELEELNAMAKQLGATTKFTATESAQAMTYMAMAGWSANEMLAGMDGVLQLAAASGEDLAMVSDIVTDNLTAFRLSAADTAHFSDVLAAAATNSNTSVSIMGDTFKNCAAIAGALGFSVDDVAVAVGLMANAGIKGSNAGTALKNTLNGLVGGVTLTGAALGEYEFTAVKADGTMKSFSDTIDELRTCFNSMTEAEKFSNAQAIAGQRTYNGLLALLNATDEEYASLRSSIADCSGAAAQMAAIKLDNLNGELTLMNSAWDALKTTIGEQFIPEMRTLYSVGTDVFGLLDGFVQENPVLVKSVTAFVGVLGTATAAMTAYAAISKVVKALNMATMFGEFTNPVFAATVGVAALAAEVVFVANAMDDATPSVKELTEAAREMGAVMDEAGATLEDTVTSALATADMAGIYIDRLEELEDEMSALEAAGADTDAQSKEYHNTLELLCRAVPELTGYIDLETNSIKGGTEALRENTEAWEKKTKQQAYQEYLNSLYDNYNAILSEIAKNEIELTQATILQRNAERDMKQAYEEFLSVLGMTDEEFKETWGTIENYQAAGNGLLGDQRAAIENYNSFKKALQDATGSVDVHTQAIEDGKAALADAGAAIDTAKESLGELLRTLGAGEGLSEEAVNALGALGDAIEPVLVEMTELAASYTEAYAAALESIQGQYEIWDKVAPAVATSIGSINTALESQTSYWQDYNTNLQSLAERSADIEGLSEVIASFADGSADSVNAIAGMANASDKDLAAMVENWNALQAAQSSAGESLGLIKVDLDEATAEMVQILENALADMDMPDEAAESARSTIQAFIDQADNMRPAVQAAYAQLAKAAADALGLSFTGMLGTGSGTSSTPTASEYALAMMGSIPADKYEAAEAMVAMLTRTGRAYASGTLDAAPGLALVGEQGPELVNFRGGEQVVPTAAMAAMLDNKPAVGAPVSVQFQIQIEGNATPETVEMLQAYGDEFAERVREVIDEANAEALRRTYR